MYYRVCPFCGANLDPGERCDCAVRSEKENPPADAGTSTSGKANNNFAVHYFTALYQKNQERIAAKGW